MFYDNKCKYNIFFVYLSFTVLYTLILMYFLLLPKYFDGTIYRHYTALMNLTNQSSVYGIFCCKYTVLVAQIFLRYNVPSIYCSYECNGTNINLRYKVLETRFPVLCTVKVRKNS